MNDIIILGNNSFSTLFAISLAEQERGLMGVNWPPPIMSFPYASPRINKFWMANTPSPLDILFCKEGKILDIQYGDPYSTKAIGGDYLTDLIVEMPYGTCKIYNIKVGDNVSFQFADHSINKLGVFATKYKNILQK